MARGGEGGPERERRRADGDEHRRAGLRKSGGSAVLGPEEREKDSREGESLFCLRLQCDGGQGWGQGESAGVGNGGNGE